MTLKDLFDCFYYGSSDFDFIEIWQEDATEEPRHLVVRVNALKGLRIFLDEHYEMKDAKVLWANVNVNAYRTLEKTLAIVIAEV